MRAKAVSLAAILTVGFVAGMAVAGARAALWPAKVAATSRADVHGDKDRFLADMTRGLSS